MTARQAQASEYHGRVTFGGLPLPGATIKATRDNQTLVAISDLQGDYSFADLSDGAWKIEVEMQCFSTIEQAVTIAPSMPPGAWELKPLSLDQIIADARKVKAEVAPVLSASSDADPSKGETPKPSDNNATEKPKSLEEIPSASDGLLINGSVNNAATSQFSLAPGFG
ncbi:MAG: carboxypeptidase-like regulatory domain-containing protein, partial [Edaphobacter sp.]